MNVRVSQSNFDVQELNMEFFNSLSPPEQFLLGPANARRGITIEDSVRFYALIGALSRFHAGGHGRAPMVLMQRQFSTIAKAVEGALPDKAIPELRKLSPVDVIGASLYLASRVRTDTITQFYNRAEFSDGLAGLDFMGEVGQSTPRSLSLGFKDDASPTRQDVVFRIARFAQFIYDDRIYRQRLRGKDPGSLYLIEFGYVYDLMRADAIAAAVARAQGLHISLSTAYTTVNGAGSLFSYGASVSALTALKGNRGVFTVLGSIQGFSIVQDGDFGPSSFLPGAGLMWQDAVSSLDKYGPVLKA